MSLGQDPNKKSNKGKVQIVHAEAIVECPMPVFHVKPTAKSIKEWLYNICDGKIPGKSIGEFRVELSKSSIDGYRLCLYGVNSYVNNTNGIDIKIEYQPKPADMYFLPAKTDRDNLDYQQFKEKIILQIKEILNTEKIKHSFLAKAVCIYLAFNDEKIILK